jgi:uncharacterized membrane protein
MSTRSVNEFTLLNKSENEQINKLHSIVTDAINEQQLILEQLKNPPQDLLTRGQKLSDKVAQFGGSWFFIIIFFIVLLGWIIFNVISIQKLVFDPYPFILMNLILSCVAAIQAPIIMMSQNRQEEKDRKRAENDYLINLKAEIEIRNINQKLNLLMEEQLHKLVESQALEIKLLDEINKKLQHPKPPEK